VDNEMLGNLPFAPRHEAGALDSLFRPQEEQKMLYFHQAEVRWLRVCFADWVQKLWPTRLASIASKALL
jgi:hypothetical protein